MLSSVPTVLANHMNKKVNQNSPLHADLQRVVHVDEDGVERITFEPVDYSDMIASHGSFLDWSIANLQAAGINPNFAIHTSGNTRIEAAGQINDLAEQVDSAFAEQGENSSES